MKQKSKLKKTEIGMIPEDWEVKKVKEIGIVITGKTPPTKNRSFYGDKYLFIRIPDIKGTIYVYKTEIMLSEEGKNYMSNLILPKDSVCVSCLATIGKLCLTTKESFTNQQINSIIPNKTIVEPLFVYYYFKLNKNYLESLGGGGSVYTNISKTRFENAKIFVPPLSEQRAIAKILSDLDSKIELLQKQNKTLEAIGQAIFKHWFVDFEFPNKEGKPYKSSGGEMVYNEELGKEIPKGWRVSQIGKELKVELGGTPDRTKKEYWNGDINWINSGKINEFRIIEPSERITKEGLEKSATKLLPKGTVVLAITGATLGQVSRLEIDSCANQSVIGILENEELPSEYIYFWIKKMIYDIIRWQTGGAQQHINKGNVENSLILVPSSELIKEYLKIAKNIFDRISLNCFESRKLSQIRDSLLPRLMSGKIRVPVGTNR